ncbi:MAG: BatA and WFA domain-containing protein [Gemmatimonadota bacterium]|nr:MAG: BatA and WFA domain-containing protein [Gemmatimonadota bacterium]
MGFSFLAPLFLAGMAAIAVPIIIHLTHRQRKESIAFPSLMFVRQIPYRTVRRQRIRHWLLFLMRSAAIVLVVAAFARPLLDRSTAAAAAFATAREVVILLDRSHSMAYGDRWARAQDAARRVVDGVGPDDRVTLVLFGERAEAVTQPTADRALLRAALDAAEISSSVTRYGPAFQLAREITERSDKPLSEVVLITDFQKAGWDPRQAARLPEGTGLTSVDLSEDHTTNLAVTGAALTRSRDGGRERVTVTARLANLGGDALEDVPVSLTVGGERLQEQRIDLEPGAFVSLHFEPFVSQSRPLRATVRAGDDALPGDNAFHVLVEPDEPLGVLIIEPRGAGADHSLYLRRALEVGGRPGFRVATGRITQLSPADIDGQAAVILNDAPFPTGAAGRRLREFVEAGGGLLAVLGRRSPPGAWPAEALEFLPASFGGPVDRSAAGGGTLGYLDYDHPAFELFRTPRSGDFSAARFFRYRRTDVGEPGRSLARFDDGTPAMVEARRGEGTVLLWASDLENFWNDLAVQPVFLPFVHEVVKHLASYVEPKSWYEVGDVLDLTQNIEALGDVDIGGTELVFESPSGARTVLEVGEEPAMVRLEEAGFHELRPAGDGERWSITAAANLDPSESDLTPLDPEELAAAVTAQGESGEANLEAVVLSPEERERRQGLWWYLLVGAAGLLLAETLISNRTRGSYARR